MKFNPKIHHRKSIRLKNYDYSQTGFYFITLCCQNHKYLFGEIVGEKMILNVAGKMIENIWNEIPIYYNGFNPHEFIVMPNHFHGIIEILWDKGQPVGAGPRACPTIVENKGQPQGVAPTTAINPTTLGDIVHRFKTLTTKRYINGVKNNNWQRFDGKLWQRNYWEHIIRNENEYQDITEYIINNPLKWDIDKLNNDNTNKIMESQNQYSVSNSCPKKEVWMV